MGYGTGTQTGLGDTTGHHFGRYLLILNDGHLLIRHLGDPATSTGFETEARHHKHHLGGHGKDEKGKPSVKDKIVGDVEQLVGKVTSNPQKVEQGALRAVSWILFFFFCLSAPTKYLL